MGAIIATLSTFSQQMAERIRRWVKRDRLPPSALDEIIRRYDSLLCQTDEAASELRQNFLHALGRVPSHSLAPQASQQVAAFLAEQMQSEDFLKLRWQSPERVITYCEVLHRFPFENETQAERIREHVRTLLTEALLAFERAGDFEKLFTLLQIAPSISFLDDHELRRLHSRAYVYEQRRVQRHRRLLYGYLLLQVILIALVFPLLFINAENGALQDQIEQATAVELPEEGRRYFTYPDGLYWALITAASIGYGDITPQTDVGRIIAAVLGVLGVITVGVIAGLILIWISPRVLD